MSRKLIRVAVFDDHALIRDGVIHVLQSSKRLEVIGSGRCCADAVEFARKEKPDVIILDIGMPGGGIEAATRIAYNEPGVRCIMLTISKEEDDVVASFMAGAKAYVLKGTSGRELIQIVLTVYKGGEYISADLTVGLLTQSHRPLSDRQSRDLPSNMKSQQKPVSEFLPRRENRKMASKSPSEMVNQSKTRVTSLTLKQGNRDRNRDEISLRIDHRGSDRRTYH